MPDVRIDVYADTHGAPKQLGDTTAALAGVEKGAGAADGTMGGLWKQVALGEIAFGLAKKAGRLFVDFLKDCATAAIEAERADKTLEAALITTGRPVENLSQHFREYATALSKVTIYDDEAIKKTQALLLSLTHLDEKGLDAATKGTIGLASVMGMDLESAATVVGKAMAGNIGILSRYGVRVSETGTAEEKRAEALGKLGIFYQRAEKDTETYGGKLTNLKKTYGEIQEAVGKMVTSNVALMDSLSKVAEGLLYLANADDMLAAKDAILREQQNRQVEWLSKAAVAAGWHYGQMSRLIEVYHGNILALTLAINKGKEGTEIQKALNQVVMAAHSIWDKEAEARRKATEGAGAGTEADKEAIAAKKKLADAAADIVAKYNPLLGAMMKLKAEEDTLTKARKAGVISAGAYDKAMAANAKAMKDVGLEAGKSAKAQGALAKAASDIITKYNPMHTAMVKAIDDEKKLDAALKAGVITDKAYAKGLESIHKDLDAAATAEKAAKTTTSAFASSIQDMVNKLKVTGPGFKTATTAEKALVAALIMGMISLKQYKKLLDDLNKTLADPTGTKTWETNTVNTIGAICAAAAVAITYIDGMNQQALQRKLAALDTAYQHELDLINQSTMNEEDKAAAITALDAEYEAKRSAAQKSAAEKAKSIAIAGAIMNTAESITAALTMKPWGPWNFVLAAIAGAMGAVQIALIKSQPIGAAKGAIFKQKALLMSQTTGQEYEVAEGGEAEIVSSPRQLREAIMGRGARGGSAQTIVEHHHHHVYIDGKEMKTFITKTIREGTKSENMLIHPRAVRTY